MNNGIGNKIKQLRESANISISDLASKTFTSVQEISKLEDGEENPSLSVLTQISNVFGVRLGTILDGTEPVSPIINKNNDKISGIKSLDKNNYVISSLAQGKTDRNMDPYVISVDYTEPGNNCQFSTHEGEEFIFVLYGNIVIYYGNSQIELSSGDSIYYDAIVPHRISSKNSDSTAKVLAVKYLP
jgi:transcriptional regulator with XRE-family HTH domain